MAVLLRIFSLYKLTHAGKNDKFVLIRTEQPSYSNAIQSQEDIALHIEIAKRNFLLQSYINLKANNYQIEFIGELQACPIGDLLYADNGLFDLLIFYQQTQYGYPYIILGNASNITEFEKEVSNDYDLKTLGPIGPILQINATLITENDFDLSEIKNYNAKDIRDI